MSGPKRSVKYYQDTVTFLPRPDEFRKVEYTLFKVAKLYFVEHWAIFSDMFSIPPSEGHVMDGSSDEHPLVLEDLNAKDFETLLGLMYPSKEYLLPLDRRRLTHETVCPDPTDAEKTEVRKAGIERYVPCVKLARRWLLHQIHAECVYRLSVAHLTGVDMVMLGKELHVPEWMRLGYRMLVERKDKLSKDEAIRIGPISTVGICNLREERSGRRADPSHYTIINGNRWDAKVERKTAAGPVDKEHIAAIEEIFEEELAFAEQMNVDFYAGVE